MKKTVWIFNHYALEPNGAGGTRHYSLACGLEKRGWNTYIFAASTELNTTRQRLAGKQKYKVDTHNGVKFVWLKAPSYIGNGIGRVMNMLVYTYRAYRLVDVSRFDKPDIIIGSSVHPLAAWVGCYLAKKNNVPFVFEVRDLWPQTLVDLGRLSDKNFLTKCLRRLERYLYERSDKIITLLPFAYRYICQLGVSKEKVFYLPNGVELDFEAAAPEKKDGFTLMYFGAHGQANGLDCLLRAMKIVQADELLNHVTLRLIGDGPLKSKLIKLSKELALTNVVFEPPVAKLKVPEIAMEADCFIFNLIDAPVFEYGISSNKLFDFLAAKRPIIFCSNSENNPVLDSGAGISIGPEDYHSLAQAITKMVETPFKERVLMGLSGRQYVEENHDYNALSKKLSDLLMELVDKK